MRRFVPNAAKPLAVARREVETTHREWYLPTHRPGVGALQGQRAPHWNQRMPMPAKTTE